MVGMTPRRSGPESGSPAAPTASTRSSTSRSTARARATTSRKSHAELDQSETLDDGNPVELGSQYKAIREKLPWLNVFGGCCGSDLRHVTEIAHALAR